MLITEIGQLATPSGAAEIRDQLLRDLNLAAVDAGIEDPPVQPGTDWHILATAVANLGLIGFANQSLAIAAQNILTATGADLDALRKGLGLPEVPAAGSSGAIIVRVTGSVTIPEGAQFVLPNGLRGQVSAEWVNPSDGQEIGVSMIDKGLASNLESGQVVRFVSPPTNLSTDAKVAVGSPLTGGTDAESDERKRARILDTLQNKPAGGNWAFLREVALESLGSVQDCYIYPALGGPASAKVVPVKAFDLATSDFSRTLSSSGLDIVRAAILAKVPIADEVVVFSAESETLDAAVKITIPSSIAAGGNGLGWLDQSVWPTLETSDLGTVVVSSSSSNSVITVSADTTVSPIAGLTHIAWWSTVDQKFTTALVVAKSGGTGAWVLTLDRALVSSDGTGPATNDYICPAARNIEAYGRAWVEMMGTLGPGENTADTDRLPRALRHPLVTEEDPSDITVVMRDRWARQFPEISSHSWSYSTTPDPSPAVPATVNLAPHILVPHKFAVYPT